VGDRHTHCPSGVWARVDTFAKSEDRTGAHGEPQRAAVDTCEREIASPHHPTEIVAALLDDERFDWHRPRLRDAGTSVTRSIELWIVP
jgi:hypothetical protein